MSRSTCSFWLYGTTSRVTPTDRPTEYDEMGKELKTHWNATATPPRMVILKNDDDACVVSIIVENQNSCAVRWEFV